MQVTTIGLDIAKNVFQVHGIDAAEKVVVRKQLRRSQVLEFFKALPPCLVGMEACATAHYWARELTKLGHQVRLMPAKDVKAYVKRNKNDAADAEAICEAVRRPTMRFVQVKSAEQQSQLMLHRTRDLLMRQRTQVINALRAHMAELGMMAAQGNAGLRELLAIIAGAADERLPAEAHASLIVLAAELQAMRTLIASIEKRIIAQHRSDEASKRLRSIPGIGLMGATAIAATITDPKAFRSGRDYRGLDRARTAARFDQRQTEARSDLETGRSLFATHSGGRSSCSVEDMRAISRRSILGSRSFSPANHSRSWRWHLPTRWRASPGRCWPRATPIGCVHWWQRRKGTGDGRMRLRLCAFTNCRGDDDVDAKRSRPSIGKPVWADAILERVRIVWDRSADHIRASGHNGCIATEVILQATTDPMKVARAG